MPLPTIDKSTELKAGSLININKRIRSENRQRLGQQRLSSCQRWLNQQFMARKFSFTNLRIVSGLNAAIIFGFSLRMSTYWYFVLFCKTDYILLVCVRAFTNQTLEQVLFMRARELPRNAWSATAPMGDILNNRGIWIESICYELNLSTWTAAGKPSPTTRPATECMPASSTSQSHAFLPSHSGMRQP